MSDPISILGFAGSLRKGSFNHLALRAAQNLLPDNASLETFDINGLPGFNQDDEANEATAPEDPLHAECEVRFDQRGIECESQQRCEVRQSKEAIWNAVRFQPREPRLQQGAGR